MNEHRQDILRAANRIIDVMDQHSPTVSYAVGGGANPADAEWAILIARKGSGALEEIRSKIAADMLLFPPKQTGDFVETRLPEGGDQ